MTTGLEGGGAAVIRTVCVTAPEVAVIVAWPAATPLATPVLGSTPTFPGVSDDQVNVGCGSSATLAASKPVAESWMLFPTTAVVGPAMVMWSSGPIWIGGQVIVVLEVFRGAGAGGGVTKSFFGTPVYAQPFELRTSAVVFVSVG